MAEKKLEITNPLSFNPYSCDLSFLYGSGETTRNKNSNENSTDTVKEEYSAMYDKYSGMKEDNSEEIDQDSRKTGVMTILPENCNFADNGKLEITNQNGERMQKVPVIYIKENKDLVLFKDPDYSAMSVLPETETGECAEEHKYPTIDSINQECRASYENCSRKRIVKNDNSEAINRDNIKMGVRRILSGNSNLSDNCGFEVYTDQNGEGVQDISVDKVLVSLKDADYSAKYFPENKTEKCSEGIKHIDTAIDNTAIFYYNYACNLPESKLSPSETFSDLDEDNKGNSSANFSCFPEVTINIENLESRVVIDDNPVYEKDTEIRLSSANSHDYIIDKNGKVNDRMREIQMTIVAENNHENETFLAPNTRISHDDKNERGNTELEILDVGIRNTLKNERNCVKYTAGSTQKELYVKCSLSSKDSDISIPIKNELKFPITKPHCTKNDDYLYSINTTCSYAFKNGITDDESTKSGGMFPTNIMTSDRIPPSVDYSSIGGSPMEKKIDQNRLHVLREDNEEPFLSYTNSSHENNCMEERKKSETAEVKTFKDNGIKKCISYIDYGDTVVIDILKKDSEINAADNFVQADEKFNNKMYCYSSYLEASNATDAKGKLHENFILKNASPNHSSDISKKAAETYENKIAKIENKKTEPSIACKEDGYSSDITDKIDKTYENEIAKIENKEEEHNTARKEDGYSSNVIDIDARTYKKEFPKIANKEEGRNIACNEDSHSTDVTNKAARTYESELPKIENKEVESNIGNKEVVHSTYFTNKSTRTHESKLSKIKNKEPEYNIAYKEDAHSTDLTDKATKTYGNKIPNIENKEIECNVEYKKDGHSSDVTCKAAKIHKSETAVTDKETERNIGCKGDNRVIMTPPYRANCIDAEEAQYMQQHIKIDVTGKVHGYEKGNEGNIYMGLSEDYKAVCSSNDKKEPLEETSFYRSCQETFCSYISTLMGFGIRKHLRSVNGTEIEISNAKTETTEDYDDIASSNFCHSSSIKHEMSNPSCFQNCGYTKETIATRTCKTSSHDIKTLEDALNYFNLSTILEQLENSLEDVRRHKKTKEAHEEFLKGVDKQIQKLSFKFHPDRIRNKGGSEEEIKNAEKLQGAINSIRTALNALNEAFFEDLSTDHRYGFYTKLDLTSLANENAVKSHVYEVVFQIGLLSETKRRNVIAEIQRFLNESQHCVQSYFNHNVVDFEKHRDSALFHLNCCIDGYKKLHNELSMIEKECRKEKMDSMSLTINRMCFENEKSLKVLIDLEGVAKESLAGSFQIFTTTDTLDEYYVLPFVYYVNVLLLCNVMIKSGATKNFNKALKHLSIDFKTLKFGGLPFTQPYLLASSFISNEWFSTNNVKKDELKEEFDDHLRCFDNYLKDTFKASDYADGNMKSNFSEEIKKCMKMMFEFQTKEKQLSENIEKINKKTECINEKYEKIMAKNKELNKITQEQVEKNKKLSHRTSLVLSEKLYVE